MIDIAVSDTNILIDLMDIGLIDEFFQLDVHVLTTDFVRGLGWVKKSPAKARDFFMKSCYSVACPSGASSPVRCFFSKLLRALRLSQ